MPKATVVVFPGSNCNVEAHDALQNAGFEVSYTWYHGSLPQGLDLCFLPGGFSYGDRLRSGAIASFSSIIGQIKKFAQSGGYVIGVCNGFQVLTESHLLEGALLKNIGGSFICNTVTCRVVNTNTVFTKGLPSKLTMQIAHASGRYFCNKDTLKKLQDENKIAFEYEESHNGSLANIAGILGGKNNNILGMMPHPERDLPTGTNGMEIFHSILNNAFGS